MAKDGRIEGRINGDAYEIVQFGAVIQTMPLAEAYRSDKLKDAIRRNKWQQLP